MMKIRIKGNSVRFRLTKTEVELFCKQGQISEVTEFQSKKFYYALEIKSGIKSLQADFTNDTITLFLPDSVQTSWATDNVIGHSNEVDWNDKNTLSLLVEKDFTCLDNTIEDQTDNYPNPKLNS